MRHNLTTVSLGLVAFAFAACSDPVPAPDPVPADPRVFRAVAGVSMGGYAAGYIGTRFGDMFDTVGILGGPVDLVHTADVMRREMIGGFVTSESAQPFTADAVNIGVDAIGGFSRTGYVEIFRDFTFAIGNVNTYNPDNTYWPPGVTLDQPETIAAARNCEQPLRLTDFGDRDFNNPDSPYCAGYPGAASPAANGLWPVITYCESDGIERPPYAYVTPDDAHDPVEIGLAVDCNDNGQRDEGEPIIRQFHEPWSDTGRDGVYSKDEAGYDADDNPDPAGDDFDPFANPDGTEGNLAYDTGEPYKDTGLDGLVGRSNLVDDPYEGNNRFDRNPRFPELDKRNPRRCMELYGAGSRRYYIDAGVRDPFRFDGASRRFVQAMDPNQQLTTFIAGFPALADRYGAGRLDRLDLSGLATPHLYVEYGDRAITVDEAVDRGGDGGHVGTPLQAVERFVALMQFLGHRWQDVPVEVVPFETPLFIEYDFQSDILGTVRDLVVTPPPGYAPGSERSYPVVYLLHGHGMTPDDFAAVGEIFALMMAQGHLTPMFLVYPDGRGVGASRGSFYVNHADDSGQDPYRYADYLVHEVMPFVERAYPVLADANDHASYRQPDSGCVTVTDP